MAKKRLDQMLVDLGLVESRTKAQALILAGKVFSNEKRLDKAGFMVSEGVPLTVRGQEHPWVSRGGIKLEHAINHFALNAMGKICLDIGASTGGFTDVLLHHGAKKIFAVDVGHGQLAWKIRNHPAVTVLEKCNARYLDPTIIPDSIDCLVCDASFIGLRTILPAGLALCRNKAWAVALIKPQFEVGKDRVGPKGVVKDPILHEEVCATIHNWWATLPGWHIMGIEPSPITGPEGNREFLIAAHLNRP
ncbi:TlyA family RNA methyltransferase [Entomobacter blattae]|uniref:16S/23S rRNA (Cytidine-2'-O)-methyltransferase TlyA n=1 Tax=Entomobacter blattae TaxID=2762277 RepID=A0A7H1NUU4_9PROT|nr:TlyA family RNA methyltransferase [Entomobacter blattae]QNT79554.1 16S/23S rRNA (cytidine-2'-O)-methyltransferase TlyA [Entomobacter blattae]